MRTRLIAAFLAVMVFAVSAYALDIKAGSFSLTVPGSFENGEVTSQDISEGMTAYYRSDETLLDFDVYEFAKEKPFAEFVKEDSEGKLVTESEINGVKISSYRDVHEFEGTKYPVMCCLFEDSDEYLKIVFWLDGETAEAEALEILRSLRK